MNYLKDDSYYRYGICELHSTHHLNDIKNEEVLTSFWNENNIQRVLYLGQVVLKISISGTSQTSGNLNIFNLKIRIWIFIWTIFI